MNNIYATTDSNGAIVAASPWPFEGATLMPEPIVRGYDGKLYLQSQVPVKPDSETQRELYQQELSEKQAWLTAHDYVGTKIATGRATVEEYADTIAQMTEYANRINWLQDWLNANP